MSARLLLVSRAGHVVDVIPQCSAEGSDVLGPVYLAGYPKRRIQSCMMGNNRDAAISIIYIFITYFNCIFGIRKSECLNVVS